MLLRVLNQKYTCDGCTVCCDVVAVAEIGKPFYTRCEHIADAGCSIYNARPQGCREFVCAWAAGLAGDNPAWRPDRSGLLFFLRRFADGLWLEIYEAVPGAALDSKRLGYLVKRIIDRVERAQRVMGTRLHHHGDKIGLGFVPDQAKYPGSAAVGQKMNRYAWLDRDPTRQVFQESHDPLP